MTPITTVGSSETQNLGSTGPASMPPSPATPGYQPQPRKSGGCCGCGCLSGCLGVLILLIGMGVGFWYFVVHNARYVHHTDTLIVWSYRTLIRPKMISSFAAGMSPQEREHFLQMTDQAVDKYIALPPEEKQAILGEATTALWYLWTQQMLPPDKIPHLQKFGEELQQGWAPSLPPPQRSPGPAPSPWQNQEEPPRPKLPTPPSNPRLLN